MKADITGTMVKPKEGWQARVDALCKEENFYDITIQPTMGLCMALSPDEYRRLCVKLQLVARSAKLQAVGMLKGTLKYERDDYSVEQWMAHLIGEGDDQMNYQILLADAYEKKEVNSA